MKSFHFVAFEKKSNKSIKGERGERQLLRRREKVKIKQIAIFWKQIFPDIIKDGKSPL